MNHTISILVENEFGVLTRVAGLFSGRGYNIESLSVAPTLDPTLSRMTIVTSGSTQIIEQIIKQLNKLINVLKVQDVTSENPIERVLAFIKINLGKRNHTKIRDLVRDFDAKVVDSDDHCSIVQIVADQTAVNSLVEKLKPHGVMEFVSTGNIAIQKGKKVIR